MLTFSAWKVEIISATIFFVIVGSFIAHKIFNNVEISQYHDVYVFLTSTFRKPVLYSIIKKHLMILKNVKVLWSGKTHAKTQVFFYIYFQNFFDFFMGEKKSIFVILCYLYLYNIYIHNHYLASRKSIFIYLCHEKKLNNYIINYYIQYVHTYWI